MLFILKIIFNKNKNIFFKSRKNVTITIKKKYFKKGEIMSNIEEFKKLYNFEFEEIKAKDYEEIEKKYLALYKEGKEKGFTPVFLVLDDTLLEKFEIDMEDEDTNNMMDIVKSNLKKYKCS